MCNTCLCENELKCSVKGYQPEGWCCDYCEKHTPIKICEGRFQTVQHNPLVMGFCLGCSRKGIQLDWLHLKLQKGFCHECSLKFNKKELLNILMENCDVG